MSKRLSKILFVGPIPPPYSGPELSMQQFLESRRLKSEFQIRYLKTNFRTTNRNKGKFGVLMVFNFFKFFTTYLYYLILLRPSCVYYPITPTALGWVGRDAWVILLAKLMRVKIIIHLRGSHFRLNYHDFPFLIKRLVNTALKSVTKAMVQADYLRTEFMPQIDSRKIEVLYQGVDTGEYFPDERVRKGPIRILFMGHLTKAKGYTDVLKVIPEICEEFGDVEFYFAGEKRTGERGVFFNQVNGARLEYECPNAAERDFFRAGYMANYNYVGIITGSEKLELMRDCDIFISASYSEGFSRSVLEAMSLGMSLVYTPVGAHKEVLKDGMNGFSFLPGDLKGMKVALTELITNPVKRKQISSNNIDLVESNFSITKIIEDFKIIIEKALDS